MFYFVITSAQDIKTTMSFKDHNGSLIGPYHKHSIFLVHSKDSTTNHQLLDREGLGKEATGRAAEEELRAFKNGRYLFLFFLLLFSSQIKSIGQAVGNNKLNSPICMCTCLDSTRFFLLSILFRQENCFFYPMKIYMCVYNFKTLYMLDTATDAESANV